MSDTPTFEKQPSKTAASSVADESSVSSSYWKNAVESIYSAENYAISNDNLQEMLRNLLARFEIYIGL